MEVDYYSKSFAETHCIDEMINDRIIINILHWTLNLCYAESHKLQRKCRGNEHVHISVICIG